MSNTHKPVPKRYQPISESSTLVELIRAINEQRSEKLASYLQPSLLWKDIVGWNTETGEPIVHRQV